MPSPIVIFTAGMGTVAVALSAGFAGSHFLVSPPAKPLQTVLSERASPPPPTVARVERKTQLIGGMVSETTGAGSAWVGEVPQAAGERNAPIAPTIPYLAPIATIVDPPLVEQAIAQPVSPVTEAPSPVTAGLRPAGPAPEVQVESPANPTEVKPTAPQGSVEVLPKELSAQVPAKAKTEKRKQRSQARDRAATQARQGKIEPHRKKKPVIVERWRERIDENVDEPRMLRVDRAGDIYERQIAPQRDFFSTLFGADNR